MGKQRIDALLVLRGLAENKSKAQALIMSGEVRTEDKKITKPGTMVPEDILLTVEQKPLFVSRGGVKLACALDQFGIDVRSTAALDVGASTGGFTDCLLQRGAKRVYAIDVGYGQLDYKLRQDQKVVVMERVNAHYPFTIPEKVDIATIDVSFISVTKVIPNIMVHLNESGYLVILLKPQFEAERSEVGKKGIIKDPQVHSRVLARFVNWMTNNGLRLVGLVASPVFGAEGNREFLIGIRTDLDLD
jgi:23S rRNA (cytidine1920-2'-O)/16S rRNA (cytidine1409-2'-O)-methyltransferase